MKSRNEPGEDRTHRPRLSHKEYELILALRLSPRKSDVVATLLKADWFIMYTGGDEDHGRWRSYRSHKARLRTPTYSVEVKP